MGALNTTTYYNLSQFVGTDKPAWLQDYNGDMLKIDTGINAAKVAADSAGLDASAAQLDATTALNSITNTITPAITSLQTTVGNQGGAINTINSLIGNGTPTTTDQTIIGAINEINAEVGQISTDLSKNNLAAKVDITSYNSNSNMYECPSDGYVIGRTSSTSGDMIQLAVYGNDGDTSDGMGAMLRVTSVLNNQGYDSLYVRKGMKVVVTNITGTSNYAYFKALTV